MLRKTIVIDDEPNAVQLLRLMLQEYAPETAVLGDAGCVNDAIQLINRSKPDLIFLDIHLKQECGWDILEKCKDSSYQVIVTSGHEEHALAAFQYGVIDYLLKPYTPTLVRRALARTSPHALPEQNGAAGEIKIPVSGGYRYLKIEDIVRLEASRNYTWIYTEKEPPVLVSKTLSHLDEQLKGARFIRIHHSHLVSPQHIISFNRHSSTIQCGKDGILPVSREHKKEVQEFVARR